MAGVLEPDVRCGWLPASKKLPGALLTPITLVSNPKRSGERAAAPGVLQELQPCHLSSTKRQPDLQRPGAQLLGRAGRLWLAAHRAARQQTWAGEHPLVVVTKHS